MTAGETLEEVTRRPRICAASGLQLLGARGEHTFRVAQTKYGPMNPQPRPEERPGANVDAWRSWQRWDVPGHRTIYAGTSKRLAFAEVLGAFKRRLEDNPESGLDLSKYLDDIQDADSGWAAVAAEWGNQLPPYTLPASWRNDRMMYKITVPRDGWFVDITTFQSITALEKTLGPQLVLLGVTGVDLSLLSGGRRDVTCEISEWVHALTLDDGSRPHGVVYPSRHGGERCWATWLRRIDDGLEPATEPSRPDSGSQIPRNDPDLLYVLQRFGLKCF
ncbi:RES domain-containing protein [Arthrobacter sp. MMS24-S77]